MAIRGDFDALRALAQRIARVGDSAALRALSKQLSEEGLTQAADGFRAERDPYGAKWAPLAERRGRILQDTGRLARSFKRVELGPQGFTLGSNVVYAAVHQNGAVIARKGGFTARTRGGRFKKRSTAEKQQKGKVRVAFGRASRQVIPARMMLPSRARGLGPVWGAAFRTIANGFMRRIVGQR